MASTLLVIAALALAISVQGTLGGIIRCEDLNEHSCSYAVSSTGRRCVLDKGVSRNGLETFNCATSEIMADKLSDLVETEECITACGVDRKALGISSDSLMDRTFAKRLCSKECYSNCHNIVDLYFNLAAGEGVFLPKFCESKQFNGRREMSEVYSLKSSADVADSPDASPLKAAAFMSTADESNFEAPAPAPESF